MGCRSSSRSTARGSKPKCCPGCRRRCARSPSNSPPPSAMSRAPASSAPPRSAATASTPRSARARRCCTRRGCPPTRSRPGSTPFATRPIPETSMLGFSAAIDRLTAALLLVAAACAPAPAQTAEPVAVELLNASHPTRCAEEDNVYVKLAGADVTGFRPAVRHPAYIGDIAEDSTAPDFSQCDMSHDPSFPFTPRDVVLYDDGHYRLMGHTYKTNWRPEVVPFRVVGKGGGKEERGLHLVQLLEYVD